MNTIIILLLAVGYGVLLYVNRRAYKQSLKRMENQIRILDTIENFHTTILMGHYRKLELIDELVKKGEFSLEDWEIIQGELNSEYGEALEVYLGKCKEEETT